MRVAPPTNTTSSMSTGSIFASDNAAVNGWRNLSTRSSVSCSNLARVNFTWRCFGPDASAVTYGRFISVSITDESSILAFSAASRNRCKACRSSRRSMPWSRLNPSATKSTIRSSQSSPPKWVSPFVAFTSITPSPTSRMLTSNVPPPRSKTKIVSSVFLSKPYAKAAAVGSLMILNTSRPAMRPASLVACRWLSLK